ncbi:uncharacterized protein BDR25DRAFT_267485 [Lindgomyces ingoldianus]|uniref:Uncharacterized protein n=1 Tax=Lindgomyces ingoldianus TaxID=673940 RepID=A0ACB6QK68_9PLEO|nr:uncharacterized protein BDR25DRAFT_267485 [Lindgomyces ingoldianus]KAF2467328.1 hypothetical protein BDR25DRAFT_267485 [Lindgomyces ingoldianus]
MVSRLETNQSDLEGSMSGESPPAVKDPLSNDVYSDEGSTDKETPLSDLCNAILMDLEHAVEKGTGWAWKDINVAVHLHDVLISVRHWKNSVHWLAIGANAPRVDENVDLSVSRLLDSVEFHDSFLSGTVRLYLDAIAECVNNIRLLYSEEGHKKSPTLEDALKKDLESAVQCLGLQLTPIRAFAESKTYTKQSDLASPEPQLVNPETNLDNESLGILLLDQRVQIENPRLEAFWPLGALKKILSEKRIATELREYRKQNLDLFRGRNVTKLTNRIRSQYLKIFAILALLEKGQQIGAFIDEGVCDKDLPLIKTGTRYRFEISCRRSPDHSLSCFQTWKAYERDAFLNYQRQVNVPYFSCYSGRTPVKHVEFPTQTILPFIMYTSSMDGGFSNVSKVKIHPESHNFDGILEKIQTKDVFAIKRLQQRQEHNTREMFQREVSMLKRLSHNHLVSLLMTWNYQGDYYLLFPWAECDLFAYWADKSHAPSWYAEDKSIDPETVRWMSGQILGMMDALDSIHSPRLPNTEYGRHGDLKPQNILCYEDPQGGRGTLVISDFGSSSFHTEHSRSNILAAGLPVTLTYRPPEFDIEGGKVSRASDIWSFGCVLLEFVCWALGGIDLIRIFTRMRLGPYITGIESDHFFETMALPGGGHAMKVKGQVSKFIAELHSNDRCTQYFHEFLDIIEDNMIVVLSKNSRRSQSSEILGKLTTLHQKVTENKDYCQRPCPMFQRPKTKAAVEVVLNEIISIRTVKYPGFNLSSDILETKASKELNKSLPLPGPPERGETADQKKSIGGASPHVGDSSSLAEASGTGGITTGKTTDSLISMASRLSPKYKTYQAGLWLYYV